MIALIDGNNFFVSCERVFRPDLISKPVAVLSNNDGCIIARSNEVKEMGIPMGAPYFKYKPLLDQHKVTLFSSNFTLYGDMSARMMDTLQALAPRIEVYSIDEAFLDCAGILNLEGFAHHIRKAVWTSLGLPTSIGIAPTKVLAKVANHFAKKVPAFHSVCVLKEEARINKALQLLKVEDIWGIGRKLAHRLKSQGIVTAYDLKKADPRWMRQHFTVVGERIVRELNGVSCLQVEDVSDPKKSMQVTRSFSKPITGFEELRSVLATYATRLAHKLRQNQLTTSTIEVFIRTNYHRTQDAQYSNSHTLTLPCPGNDDISLIKAASQAFEQIYREGFRYSKAGVMAFNLTPQGKNTQLDLFSHNIQPGASSADLWKAIDQLKDRYGVGIMYSAACGPSLSWKDKKERMSPHYTTHWEDLPIILAK